MQLDLSPKQWFENASTALRLPPWVGVCIVGLIPAAGLWYLGIDIRIATDFTGFPPVSLPLLVVNVSFLLLASLLIRSRTLQLRDYTRSLGVEPDADWVGRLTSLRAIASVWVVLLVTTSLVLDPYVFGLYYSPTQIALRLFVTSYLRFIQATFLWVLGYAMYLIYKWGRLPIRLKSFTEDSTLGLNAYGRASLLFVTLYIVGMLLTFPVFVYKSEAIVWSQTMFSLLGLALFLGPLFSLRRKLVEARKEKLAWISRRHRRVIESIETGGDGPIDPLLVNELLAVDNIRNDLHRISSWPFNASIVVRLITVVITPLALILFSTYLVHALGV